MGHFIVKTFVCMGTKQTSTPLQTKQTTGNLETNMDKRELGYLAPWS